VRPWARENGFIEPPLQFSPLCGSGELAPEFADELTVTHPDTGDAFLLDPLIPDVNEQITLRARAGFSVKTVQWFVDGKLVGGGAAPDFDLPWKPVPGTHQITVKAGEESDSITIEVSVP
jgi:membrane carboxypeptidase/penicillin-binding protein PbpC